MLKTWQDPALEAAKDELFHVLDLLRESARRDESKMASDRLGLVSLFLVQALRLLEGHFSKSNVGLEAWRVPIPAMTPPDQALDLLSRCRQRGRGAEEIALHFLLGPELFGSLRREDPKEPDVQQILEWLRWLREQDEELYDWGVAASRLSTKGVEISIEIFLDELLIAQDWSHPSQVLPRPRPSMTTLFEASTARLESASEDERSTLLEVHQRLERAVRIEETARRRRTRRPSASRDKPSE